MYTNNIQPLYILYLEVVLSDTVHGLGLPSCLSKYPSGRLPDDQPIFSPSVVSTTKSTKPFLASCGVSLHGVVLAPFDENETDVKNYQSEVSAHSKVVRGSKAIEHLGGLSQLNVPVRVSHRRNSQRYEQ